MSDKVRLGVVGFGRRGKVMFSLAGNIPNVLQAGMCESHGDRLEEAKKLFPNVQTFSNYEEMLSSGLIDAVIVETPADNHALFCEKALRQGIHVLSDVPCVYSYHEAEMLWQAELESSAMFMFGANPNFWGFVEAAVDAKEKGLLGEPYFLEAEYLHDLRYLFEVTPWRKTLKPIFYCTHSLGPLLTLFKEDLRFVSCFDSLSHINNQPGQHDVMTGIFRTANNIIVRVTCSFINNFKGGCHWYRVMGTEGCFERTAGRGELDPPRTLLNTTLHHEMAEITALPVDTARPGCDTVEDDHGGADYYMLDAFIKAIICGEPSPISLREGLRMSLPGLFAVESAENNGRLTEIKYPWDS